MTRPWETTKPGIGTAIWIAEFGPIGTSISAKIDEPEISIKKHAIRASM